MKRIINFLKKIWFKLFGRFYKKKRFGNIVFYSFDDGNNYKISRYTFSGVLPDEFNFKNASEPQVKQSFDKNVFIAVPMFILWALFDKNDKPKLDRKDSYNKTKTIMTKDASLKLKDETVKLNEIASKEKEALDNINKIINEDKDKVIDSKKRDLNKEKVNEDNNLKSKEATFKKGISNDHNLNNKSKLIDDMVINEKKSKIDMREAMEVSQLVDDEVVSKNIIFKNKKDPKMISSILMDNLLIPALGILSIGYIGKAFKQIRLNNRIKMANARLTDDVFRPKRLNFLTLFSKKKTEALTDNLLMENMENVQVLKYQTVKNFGKEKGLDFMNLMGQVNNIENELDYDFNVKKKRRGKVKMINGNKHSR